MHAPRRVDWIVAAAFLIAGAIAGGSYIRAYDRAHVRLVNENFTHSSYAAAVAFACGRGFVDVPEGAAPALDAFLNVRTDSFSCSELPPSAVSASPDFTQGLYRYLMLGAGVTWRVSGNISWSGLWPYFGLLFGLTLVAAYAAFRAMLGRGWAIAATIALLLSPIHLSFLPMLRDYAKAPFIIGAIAVLLHLSASGMSSRRFLALSAAFGVVAGIGFGFRNDVAIALPVFVAVVLLARLPAAARRLALKAGALAVGLGVFALTSLPILTAYSRGSNSGHVALLGLMSPFDRTLGIRAAPYDWGYVDDDSFADMIVREYHTRVDGSTGAIYSSDYDQAATGYLLLIARHWPADIIVRALAAVIKVVEMPFTISDYSLGAPPEVRSSWLFEPYRWRAALLWLFEGRGAVIVAFALIALAARSTPAAFGMLLLLIYFAGYPAIQFNPRHFFHLEFIGIGALFYALTRLADVVRWRGAEWRRALAFVAAAAVMTGGAVTVARAYQQPRVRSMLRGYLQAQRTPIGRQDFNRGVTVQYLVATFASSSCDAIYIPNVRFSYVNELGRSILTRTRPVRLVPGGAPTYILFPAYSTSASSHFGGIDMPPSQRACLTKVEQVADVRSFGVLVGATLEPGWEQRELAQTIASIESASVDPRLPQMFVDPPDTAITRASLSDSVVDLSNDIADRSRLAERANNEWTIRGRPDIPTSTLLSSRRRQVAAGARLVAQGEVRRGGISFTLFDSAHRAVASARVRETGPFLVNLAAPAAGEYSVESQADITPWFPANRIGRRVGPLVEWIPFATLREDVTLSRFGWLLPQQ